MCTDITINVLKQCSNPEKSVHLFLERNRQRGRRLVIVTKHNVTKTLNITSSIPHESHRHQLLTGCVLLLIERPLVAEITFHFEERGPL